MHGDGLAALAADGSTVKTLKYTARPATAVTALTRIFGSAPVHKKTGKSVYSGGADIYRWKGFEMRVEKSGTKLEPRIGVFMTRATVNGVALHSVDGVRVGGSAADAFAAHPGTVADDAQAFTVDSVEVGTSADGVLTHSVRVIGSSKTGKITTLLAPARNFGA